MSKTLEELLLTIRQHPGFKEMLAAIEPPDAKPYRPGQDTMAQYADYIFRSGRRLQNDIWRQFLIGEPTSQQEKS